MTDLILGLALALRLAAGSAPVAFLADQSTSPHATVYDASIALSAARHGLSPYLLKGLLLNESGLQAREASRTSLHGVGLGQWTSAGARGLSRLRQVADPGAPAFTMAMARVPSLAIDATAELLSHHLRRYGSRDAAIAAYRCPAHARSVKRHGWREAARRGMLSRCGRVPMGGYYVGHVLRRMQEILPHANHQARL